MGAKKADPEAQSHHLQWFPSAPQLGSGFLFPWIKAFGIQEWGGVGSSFLSRIFSSLNENTPGTHALADTTPCGASAQEGDLRFCGPWSCPAAQGSVMGMEKINKCQTEQVCPT